MGIEIIPSKERGETSISWLKSRHSFSFGGYHNPSRMGFGKLRVLNDDIVAAGKGFGSHPHNNMEIVTIVLLGALEHKDSSGGHGIMKKGDVQHMSAGLGVVHSEFNHSKEHPSHFLQVWVEPKEANITPNYNQKSFSLSQRKNRLLPIVLGKKSKDSLYMHQDGGFFWGDIDAGKQIVHTLEKKSHGAYVFLIFGEIEIDGKTLTEGDAAQIDGIASFSIKASMPSDVLVIEIPLT